MLEYLTPIQEAFMIFVELKKDRPQAFRVASKIIDSDQIMNQNLFLGTYPGLTRRILDYEIKVIDNFVLDH